MHDGVHETGSPDHTPSGVSGVCSESRKEQISDPVKRMTFLRMETCCHENDKFKKTIN